MQDNKELWESTAIFVTADEGGGYYDSGYVQPLDFFGDGTRIPMIVVSKYTKPGHISHQYADHVSVLKFIERNWNLPTISGRSRDNLPNPKAEWETPTCRPTRRHLATCSICLTSIATTTGTNGKQPSNKWVTKQQETSGADRFAPEVFIISS